LGSAVFRIIVASVAIAAVFALFVVVGNGYPKKSDVDIPIVTLAELLQSMQYTNTIIIDAREENSYRYGHIPNAINVRKNELNDISNLKLLSLKTSGEVIVYCGNSACGTSFFAARRLIDRGLDNVKVYAGGWGEWQSCGLPVTSTK